MGPTYAAYARQHNARKPVPDNSNRRQSKHRSLKVRANQESTSRINVSSDPPPFPKCAYPQSMRDFAGEDACTGRWNWLCEKSLVSRRAEAPSAKAPRAASHQTKAASCLQVPPVQKYGRQEQHWQRHANQRSELKVTEPPFYFTLLGQLRRDVICGLLLLSRESTFFGSNDGIRTAHGESILAMVESYVDDVLMLFRLLSMSISGS